MTKNLFYVEVTKSADIKDVDVFPYTEEYLKVSGWGEYSLVYPSGTDDITFEDALNDRTC